MRIDRDAAAIVGDRHEAVGVELDVDEARVAGERLVHGVVDHLGEEVMHRLLVGAADIHAGAAAHRFEPLQNLDILRGVAGLGRGPARGGAGGPGAAALARRAVVRGALGSANRSGRSGSWLLSWRFFLLLPWSFNALLSVAAGIGLTRRRRTALNFGAASGESSSDYAMGVAKP